MSIFTRETLANWLDDLAQEQTLIAPKDISGVLLYQPVNDSTEVVWDYRPPGDVNQGNFLPCYRAATDYREKRAGD